MKSNKISQSSPISVLLFDLGAMLVSLGIAYQLRFNFKVPEFEIALAIPNLPVYLGIGALSMLLVGSHKGILRHSSVDDVRRVFVAMAAASLITLLANTIRFHLVDGLFFLPRSVVIIAGMSTILAMLSLRAVAKLFYQRLFAGGKDRSAVVIFGTGEPAVLTKRSLEREGDSGQQVVGFVEIDSGVLGKRLDGVPVIRPEKLEKLLAKENVQQLIIASNEIKEDIRVAVVDTCLAADVQVMRVPPVTEWINGTISQDQIKNLKIEDLLGRKEIVLNDDELVDQLLNGTTLVTGAAGSIGSEICRQLLQLGLSDLVLLDFAESALYDLQMELHRAGYEGKISCVIGDVRDPLKLRAVFEEHKPVRVYHAAAYKHVPLMESAPSEAIKTNVRGTKLLAEMADQFKVERFVLISTDKAVNPTSIMGASKRAAEKVVRSIAHSSSTCFVITRFGNVLGSNGSVIPLFKKQLEAGGPLTVTHRDVTRYFMTIPEACRLVLEAACMGKGGEIYLFDMGRSIKINDLAERMIKLSGLTPHTDIEIVYTGLRPGEKLYEELLASEENSLATHHPRILIGKVQEQDHEAVNALVDELIAAAEDIRTSEIQSMLRELIPEYQDEVNA